MKIAVATEAGMVAAHFGRCPEYTLAEVEGEEVKDWSVLPNPGHEPGFLPRYLADRGVGCIIAGGMGSRAQVLFAEAGVRTVVGATGDARRAVEDWLAGRLQVRESLCDHPHGGTCDG